MKHKDQAGWRMRQVALDAGMGRQTKVHALGDGAVWIEEKVRTHFGERSSYLIDFCHLCEYLAAAVQQAPIQNKPTDLGRVKALAKKGQLATLCQWFQKWMEPEPALKAGAPVRTLLQHNASTPVLSARLQNALAHRGRCGSNNNKSSYTCIRDLFRE